MMRGVSVLLLMLPALFMWHSADAIECASCRHAMTGVPIYDGLLDTKFGDNDPLCKDQPESVGTVTCADKCSEALIHSKLDIIYNGQPLDITLFSRGCSNSSSVAGCYDIQVDTDIVSAAMGDIAPFMSMIHGGVCFCDDADSCNTKASSELHDIPYQSTTMKPYRKSCKKCVQYKVPGDIHMESMLMDTVDFANYGCIYTPKSCPREKCHDENDVCAAIHVVLGKEENGVSVPYVEVYRRGCLSDFPDATPGCYNTTRVEDPIKYMLGYPGDTCITYDQGTVCTCTERVCDITSIPGWRPACITNCDKYKDGDFQWCNACDHYVSCVAGSRYIMPCPDGLMWDDITMQCEIHSQTCEE